MELKPWSREEFGNPLKVRQADGGLDLPQRYEALYVCLEYRALVPRAKRLVNVRIDTARRNIPHQVACSPVHGINEKRCENACARSPPSRIAPPWTR